MSLYQNRVIILRSRNFGEADRILTVLSEDSGKFEALVKGARRQRSRFVGNTLPFNCLEAQFFAGKNLDILNQAELVYSFTKLREDLPKLTYASYWTELVDKFLPEHEPAKVIFRFLLAAFITLEKISTPELLNLAFILRLLNYLGYQPQIKKCIVCGAVAEEKYFSHEAGGLLCPDCKSQYDDSFLLANQICELMAILGEIDLRNLESLNINQLEIQQINKILCNFVRLRLGHPLKSQKLLDRL